LPDIEALLGHTLPCVAPPSSKSPVQH
jgi:hypothetical protein